jgi:hypothetical protein
MAVASCGQDAANDQTKLGNLNMTKDSQSGSPLIWVTVTPAPASLPAVGAYDSRVATTWFDLYLDLVQTTPGFTPPVASRAFGYAGVTLYEAVAPGMPGYQSLAGQLNELPPLPQPPAGETYHWPIVANSALAHITRYLFANTSNENITAIDALEQKFAAEFGPQPDPAVADRSVSRGQAVAEAIFIWSTTDGGHEGYLRNFPAGYTPPAGPGMWISTPPDFNAAMQPDWGDNRPFALKTGAECPPGPPPAYSEDPASAFYAEAMEVYEAVNNLTPEQEEIALFWADDPGRTATPPGHSISILNQVLVQQGASLDTAAEAYARLGMAAADSFISCWYTKYQYNLIRPISYIQQIIDPDWNTPQVTDPVTTPPFPEYTSGHSAQSGAAAQVLTGLFGDNFSFTDHTHDERGFAPRSFSSFFDFADEAAISRLYGGIHYRAAIELGIEQGKCIGQQINALKFKVESN